MNTRFDATRRMDRPTVYRITVAGVVSEQWTQWFEGMNMRVDATGDTTLTGPVVDQAELHGQLGRVRDLGLPLVAVQRLASR